MVTDDGITNVTIPCYYTDTSNASVYYTNGSFDIRMGTQYSGHTLSASVIVEYTK